MGMKLLKKLGWKPGQGVGPRISRKEKKKQLEKVYGCSLPSSSHENEGKFVFDTI